MHLIRCLYYAEMRLSLSLLRIQLYDIDTKNSCSTNISLCRTFVRITCMKDDHMNRFMKEHGETFHLTRILRDQLLGILSDDDLRLQVGGQNLTLGGLCRQMGEIGHSCIGSLKTLKRDWSYRHADTTVENSVAKLRDWYESLDTELKSLMSGFSQMMTSARL